MGKNFVSLGLNGATQKQLEDTYKRLKTKNIIEASKKSYFEGTLPPTIAVVEIEMGVDGTKEALVRFFDNSYVVFDGIVKFDTIINNR